MATSTTFTTENIEFKHKKGTIGAKNGTVYQNKSGVWFALDLRRKARYWALLNICISLYSEKAVEYFRNEQKYVPFNISLENTLMRFGLIEREY